MSFAVVATKIDVVDVVVVVALSSSLKVLETFEPRSLLQSYCNRGKLLMLMKLRMFLWSSLETKVPLGDTMMKEVSPDTIPSLFSFSCLRFSLPPVARGSKKNIFH